MADPISFSPINIAKQTHRSDGSPRKPITPLQQGSLDSSCSLYAAINLVRLSVSIVTDETALDIDEMLAECVHALKTNKRRKRLITGTGLGTKWWRRMVEAACEQASEELEIGIAAVWHDNVRNGDGVLELLHQGHPCGLLTKPGDHTHYTVICGANDRSFILFDSDRLKKSNRETELYIGKRTVVSIRIDPTDTVEKLVET